MTFRVALSAVTTGMAVIALNMTATPGPSAPYAAASSVAIPTGAAAPLTPPLAALAPHGIRGDGLRSLGGIFPASVAMRQRGVTRASLAADTGLPTSADLSAYNPPVAYQGAVQSCVSWVTGYYMRGWYAKRGGYYPGEGANGGFAPMSVYYQVTHGQNVPTSFNSNLDVEVAQGISSRLSYENGDVATSDTDYGHQPTAGEVAQAANYKIASYKVLFQGALSGTDAQQAIETSIAGGNPVGLIFKVYGNFYNADDKNYYIDTPSGADDGYHAVFASKYDANGLWIENEWGTSWGLNGWVQLSWNYVNTYAMQAVTMDPGSSTPSREVVVSSPTPALSTATPVPPTAAPVTSTALPVQATIQPVSTPAVIRKAIVKKSIKASPKHALKNAARTYKSAQGRTHGQQSQHQVGAVLLALRYPQGRSAAHMALPLRHGVQTSRYVQLTHRSARLYISFR